MNPPTPPTVVPALPGNEREILLTLFDLGRQVASVIDIEELLPKIPELIGRLIQFDALAVYLLNAKRGEVRIAYAVGYPESARDFPCASDEGVVGQVITTQQPALIGDVRSTRTTSASCRAWSRRSRSHYCTSHDRLACSTSSVATSDRYTDGHLAILRQFAAHVATAIVNARLFEQQRQDAEAFETLAEIGREVAAVLDLDQLLSNIAQLARRVVDYRTFGILLLNEQTNELEMSVGVQYGEQGRAAQSPARRGHRRLRGAPPRGRARARCVEGPALHQGARRRAV